MFTRLASFGAIAVCATVIRNGLSKARHVVEDAWSGIYVVKFGEAA
jgi:hypothetical protein